MRPPNEIDLWSDDFRKEGEVTTIVLPHLLNSRSDKTFLLTKLLLQLATYSRQPILTIRRRLSELAVVGMNECDRPQTQVRFQDLQPQALIGTKSTGKSPLLTLWKRRYTPVKRKHLRTRDGREV